MTICVFLGKLKTSYYNSRVSFFLAVLIQNASGQRLEGFVKDMIVSMGGTKPAFIFNPDETQILGWTSSQTGAMMSTSGNDPMEAKMIKDRLSFLMETDEVDIIFFLSSGQADLIRNIVNSLELLKTKISVVIPNGDSAGLKSRLNSQLYLYEILGDNIILFESYQIR